VVKNYGRHRRNPRADDDAGEPVETAIDVIEAPVNAIKAPLDAAEPFVYLIEGAATNKRYSLCSANLSSYTNISSSVDRT
jgi:hypothetical protein